MINREPNYYGIRTAHERFGDAAVNRAKQLIMESKSYRGGWTISNKEMAAIKLETGIPIGSLRFIANQVRSDNESEVARAAGCAYIVKDCFETLTRHRIKMTEHNGSYYVSGRPVTIGELITKANELLASEGKPGNLGKNSAWHRFPVVNNRAPITQAILSPEESDCAKPQDNA